jgi:hypothetical protein
MPWSTVTEAPKNIRKLNGVDLDAAQVNWIGYLADELEGEGKVDNPWAVAVAQFKRSFKVEGDKWVKKNSEDQSAVHVQKQSDGRYKIISVSTAAVADREGETFDVECIDYDAEQARLTGDYPEFRAFHSPVLGFGRVTKMSRVGIFAVDEGYSYDDPFSISVCENMLLKNDGRWRASRGFRVLEATGLCPNCNERLKVATKHMVIGYRCPSCASVHVRLKGVLSNIHFKKARTFDVTVTDVPAVPVTGFAAFRYDDSEDFLMNKEQLRKRLKAVGISDDAIEERLAQVTDERLKEFDDFPDAILLKELELEDDEEEVETKETEFVLADEVLDRFAELVDKRVEARIKELFEGLSVELESDGDTFTKERGDELEQKIDHLTELVESVLEGDTARLKELIKEVPRGAKNVVRFKGSAMKKAKKVVNRYVDEEDDEEDEEDEDEVVTKWFQQGKPVVESGGVVIKDGQGRTHQSMSAALSIAD